jgi:hypothetical protein
MSVQTDWQTWRLGRVVQQWIVLTFLMSSGTTKRISAAEKDSESTTMIKLHVNELHIKAGSARRQQFAGKQGRIINQHNTRTD